MKSLKTTIVAGAANISLHHKKLADKSSLKADRLFFIYVAKEKAPESRTYSPMNYLG
jgi:hypothetical protein